MAGKKTVKAEPANAPEPSARGRIMAAAFSAFTERGFAETSTLEIATRARVSKRELYAQFGSKQEMLIACIGERAKRWNMAADLPAVRDREMLGRTLAIFGARLLREVTDPAVLAVLRLAIAEAARAPEVGRMLSELGIEPSRATLRELMRRAHAGKLVGGDPAEMAEHFIGLLWGNRMLTLLLQVAERPSAEQATRRAEAASAAFLRAYPPPD
jgi:AcrR family transcriptional regulator